MKFERWQTPNTKHYSLIDFGEGEKLERFGEIILIRPEPLAKNRRKLALETWHSKAHARFDQTGSTTGKWISLRKHPDQWDLQCALPHGSIKFRLKLTKFKHVGIFPEQASNWEFIQNECKKHENPRVLNLFAYTGGASLAAKAAGADVTHVDSIKQVLSWSNENQEISNLDGIRWVLEDALKFAHRESKRGRKYHGIIMDPPAWGRGPKGEQWKLEQKLDELLKAAASILDPNGFAVVNTYSGLPLDTLKAKTGRHFDGFTHESKKL
ncbi:MAG: class I SAM-dependent methyltransferase, partial [Flavobacteriales bacterium]